MRKKISIAIPVYQNEGSLFLLHDSIVSVFTNELADFEYEICFTNDGSTDNSLQVLLDIRAKDNNVKIINFTRNFGQEPAIFAAHKICTGNAVITLSADLQDPVELFPEMVRKWEAGAEVVICHREAREDGYLNKITSSIYFNTLSYHSKQKAPPGGFDYFLLDRKVTDYLNLIEDKIRSIQYDILSLGFKPAYIPYKRIKRIHGKSQYNFSKRFFIYLDTLISISYIPIRLFSLLGILFAVSGFIYAIDIFIAWLVNDIPFKGWAPIMVIILISSGIIMLILGFIGEYIWRIYSEVKKRPTYIIDKIYE